MHTEPALRLLGATERVDEARVRAIYDLARRAELLGREERHFRSFTEFATEIGHENGSERLDLVVADLDGELAGVAFMWSFLADNTDKSGIQVDVDPALRRRGIGSALLRYAEGLARADGRSLMMLDTKLPHDDREEHPHARFAAACGYRLSNYEVVRVLGLPVPDARVEEWAQECVETSASTNAGSGAGYRVEVFVDGVPDRLLASLCGLMGQLVVDAPSGEVEFEEMAFTPQRYRERVEASRVGGRTRYEALALAPDDSVVAQTTLAVPTARGEEVYQWGTFVHRAHRGHRLGLAVKAANLRALQRDRTDLTSVITQNAETNDHMVAINRRIGFEPVEVAAEFIKRL